MYPVEYTTSSSTQSISNYNPADIDKMGSEDSSVFNEISTDNLNASEGLGDNVDIGQKRRIEKLEKEIEKLQKEIKKLKEKLKKAQTQEEKDKINEELKGKTRKLNTKMTNYENLVKRAQQNAQTQSDPIGDSFYPSEGGSGMTFDASSPSYANPVQASNSTSSSSGSTSTNAVLAQAKDSNQTWKSYWDEMGYNAEKGNHLAGTALRLHPNSDYHYRCATGVSQSFAAAGLGNWHGHGYQWVNNMRKMDGFKEISTAGLSKDELKDMLRHLPAGAVVSWNSQDRNGDGILSKSGSTQGEFYGHVTIADGNGGEISDHHATHIMDSRYIDACNFSNDKCTIFIPA